MIGSSWEPLTLALGPLHKTMVNKLEDFLLRFKQLNSLLFLNLIAFTKIKWKASISKDKKHSLSWNPLWSRHAFSSGCSTCAALGVLWTTRVMGRLKCLNLVIQCLKNHQLFTLETMIRVYQWNVACFPLPKPHNPLCSTYQKYAGFSSQMVELFINRFIMCG